MGTHPIFESDFDCLTENMNKHGEDETCVLWCGNLDLQVTQEHLYELMMQAGPVEKVTKPKEKNFAFILFKHRESVGYALKVVEGIELFERRLNMRQRETGARNNRDDSTQVDKSIGMAMDGAGMTISTRVVDKDRTIAGGARIAAISTKIVVIRHRQTSSSNSSNAVTVIDEMMAAIGNSTDRLIDLFSTLPKLEFLCLLVIKLLVSKPAKNPP